MSAPGWTAFDRSELQDLSSVLAIISWLMQLIIFRLGRCGLIHLCRISTLVASLIQLRLQWTAGMRLKMVVKLREVLVRKVGRKIFTGQLRIDVDCLRRLEHAPLIKDQLEAGSHLDYSQILGNPVDSPVDPRSRYYSIPLSNPLLLLLGSLELRLLGSNDQEIENSENQDR